MVMHAAWKIDTAGKREARQEIAEIKVQAANMVMNVLDRAIQLHGALGHERRHADRALLARAAARCGSSTAPTKSIA